MVKLKLYEVFSILSNNFYNTWGVCFSTWAKKEKERELMLKIIGEEIERKKLKSYAVVELGPGHAEFLEGMKRHLDAKAYIGIDLSDRAIFEYERHGGIGIKADLFEVLRNGKLFEELEQEYRALVITGNEIIDMLPESAFYGKAEIFWVPVDESFRPTSIDKAEIFVPVYENSPGNAGLEITLYGRKVLESYGSLRVFFDYFSKVQDILLEFDPLIKVAYRNTSLYLQKGLDYSVAFKLSKFSHWKVKLLAEGALVYAAIIL